MKTSYKKIGLSLIIAVVLFVILLVSAPFLFQKKIIELVKKELNNQLVTDVDFDKVKLSFIRNFPDASIHIDNLLVTGRDDFQNDTILQSKSSVLVINLKSLFGDSGYDVKKLVLKDATLFAHELEDGRANWYVFPPDSLDTEESSFHFKLQDTQFLNVQVSYLSENYKTAALLKNSNLIVSGDFGAVNTLLKTKFSTEALSFWSEGVQLTHDWALSFDADIKANINEDYYELADNNALLNAIPLALNGWVKLLDDGYDMDLEMITDQVDFKSILSLIPAVYADSFDDLTATGNVDFSGHFKGVYDDDNFPAFDIVLAVANGNMQYTGLPKSVNSIFFDSKITNPGGSFDNTVVDVPKFSFVIDKNPFGGALNITHPMSDPNFNLHAKGKLDLNTMKDVFPLEEGMKLAGLLEMDLAAAGKMSYVENNLYDKFRFEGDVLVRDMNVEMKDLDYPVAISSAELLFNNRFLNLKDLRVKLGDNDLQATGRVENYLAYALKDDTLVGEMSLLSKQFNLNDFMSDTDADAADDSTSITAIEIPKNLDLSLKGKFDALQLDKMHFKNSTAEMGVKDGRLSIHSMETNAFGGKFTVSGNYDALNPQQPHVDFDLDLQAISFVEIMAQVQFLEKFVPIFQKMDGKFNTKLKFNSALTHDMSPVLSSIQSLGNFKTELLGLGENVEALSKLMSSLKLDKLSDFNIKDLAVNFEIKDGALHTKPFNLTIKDYKLNLGGSTSLDQIIDYAGTISLPDNMNLKRFQEIGFKIGGTFQKPTVSLDIKNTIDHLIQEKVDQSIQKVDSIKTELVDKGKAELDKAIKEAEIRANKVLENAQLQSDKLVAEAQVRADSIVSKATNPVTKAVAKKAADELVKQAQKQADTLNEKAKLEADKIVQGAKDKTETK